MQRKIKSPFQVDGLQDLEFALFLTEFKEYEIQCRYSIVRDEFLDVYSAWLKTQDPQYRQRVIQSALELSRLDPQFQFSL